MRIRSKIHKDLWVSNRGKGAEGLSTILCAAGLGRGHAGELATPVARNAPFSFAVCFAFSCCCFEVPVICGGESWMKQGDS